MKLTELLPAIEEKFDLKILESLEISNITSDSRKVSPGGLFFAIQGEKFDGVNFARGGSIDDAPQWEQLLYYTLVNICNKSHKYYGEGGRGRFV